MDLLPISALQHLLYCERQCALIHLEQVWAENQFTVEGNVMHEKAHDGLDETRAGVRIVRGLAVKSEALGLSGQCDVVEFHRSAGDPPASGSVPLPHEMILPIEYKRGKPKAHRADEVQLCAQAMCLEEMFGSCVRKDVESDLEPPDHLLAQAATIRIPEGRIFYGQTRRRLDVVFDAELRALTTDTARRLREMIASRITPPAVYEEQKCEACSLKELCMPQAMRFQKGAGAWFARQMAELTSEGRAAGPLAAAAASEIGALMTTSPTC
jgi:CRISPR-associated exonuclease Cas4